MDQRSLYLLRQAITAIFKRWRLVALLIVTIVVPFNFFNFLIRQPVYSARSMLMITKDRGYVEVSPLDREHAVASLPNEMIVNSEIQLLRSRDLIRRLHDELETQSATNPEGAFPVPTIVQLEQRVS